MFQTTRRRLALWYTTATAILLLLFATGFYLYVRETLIDRVDDTLKHVVEVVERSIWIQVETQTFDPTASHQSIESLGFSELQLDPVDVEDDHIDLEWFRPNGQRLWSTSSQPTEVPLQFPGILSTHARTVYLGSGYGLRQLTEPIKLNDQILGYLRVSHPWFEVTKPIRQLSIDLSLGLVLMVGSTAGIGWLLSGLAMEPVWEAYERLKQFTADASHELRSPIASIQTNVQVALSDPYVDPQVRHTWKVVERLTRRLSRLVEDLLFLARQDSGITQVVTPQPCPLDEILIEVIEEQIPTAQERHIQLTFDIQPATLADDDTFILLGYYDQLAQLFTNLIANGLQYTPAHGSVHVLLAKQMEQQTQSEPKFQIKVTDNGIGIPAEELPNVFNRFYRVEPSRSYGIDNGTDPALSHNGRGSGLGLAIAQVIVANHQGEIQVTSDIGQGSTFTVILPDLPHSLL